MAALIEVDYGDTIPTRPDLGFARSTPAWNNKREHLVPYEPMYGNALCGAGAWGGLPSAHPNTGHHLCPACVKEAGITAADIERGDQ